MLVTCPLTLTTSFSLSSLIFLLSLSYMHTHIHTSMHIYTQIISFEKERKIGLPSLKKCTQSIELVKIFTMDLDNPYIFPNLL